MEIEGIANAYNANEFEIKIWNRWDTSSGGLYAQVNGKRCEGFNNWDIAWNGYGNNGTKALSDTYTWRLELKNCDTRSTNHQFVTYLKADCLEYFTLFGIKLWCKKYGPLYWHTEDIEYGHVVVSK